MKCLKCRFDNPEGMKFCGKCRTKLEHPLKYLQSLKSSYNKGELIVNKSLIELKKEHPRKFVKEEEIFNRIRRGNEDASQGLLLPFLLRK